MILLQQGAKIWDDSSKKNARRTTIIDPYRKIFGESLPTEKQYWTLCGEMASKGKIQDGCELNQVVQEGLIFPEQFHGVEGNKEIYLANINAMNDSQYGAHFYCGEFTEVLDQILGEGNLNPGIIYLDTIQEPKGSSALLAKTLDILNNTIGNILLTWNFIKDNNYRNRHYSWEYVKKELDSNALFRLAIRYGWRQLDGDKTFKYGGTGKTSTTMGSIVFIRV